MGNTAAARAAGGVHCRSRLADDVSEKGLNILHLQFAVRAPRILREGGNRLSVLSAYIVYYRYFVW
jgi:hypothetical protein